MFELPEKTIGKVIEENGWEVSSDLIDNIERRIRVCSWMTNHVLEKFPRGWFRNHSSIEESYNLIYYLVIKVLENLKNKHDTETSCGMIRVHAFIDDNCLGIEIDFNLDAIFTTVEKENKKKRKCKNGD